MSNARIKLSTLLLLAMAGCASQQEVPVAVGDLPPPVRATLERESMGGEVTESEQEVEDGRTVYSFDVLINGKEYDLEIAENGDLLSKKLEDPDPSDPRAGGKQADFKRDSRHSGVGNLSR